MAMTFVHNDDPHQVRLTSDPSGFINPAKLRFLIWVKLTFHKPPTRQQMMLITDFLSTYVVTNL